jgi:GAF domain-containing protein
MPEKQPVRNLVDVVNLTPIRNLSLKTRLILSMTLVTGLAALAIGLIINDRAQQIRSVLLNELGTTVEQEAQQGLQDQATIEAGKANETLENVVNAVIIESKYLSQTLSQEKLFGAGEYWDARQKLTSLPAGQFDNPNTDVGSVVVPAQTGLNDATVAELNTLVHLDFLAPGILKNAPDIVSTYYVGANGITLYYPNINLARIIGNADATTEIFYQVAAPANNPKRQPVWTAPYQDTVLTDLVITSSMPVYDPNDKFRGVISASVQLSKLAEQARAIKVGTTGYAFLIDQAGHILFMPEQAYLDLGVPRESVPAGEPLKNTILGQGSEAFQAITNQMVQGHTGKAAIKIHEIEYFAAYAPLTTTGYSLGIIVPSAEMTTIFRKTQAEIETQSRQTINLGLVLFGGVLLLTTIFSWGLGQLLINPFTELTKVAQQIAAGDLARRAKIRSNDEAGILGNAFNIMADEVSLLVQNLEENVTERTAELRGKTAELELLSNRQKRRAEGLQAVAEVSRAITSIQSVNDLLPKITRVVSDQFNFYHVGVFLIDSEKRFAKLSATNSEGGRRMLERGHQLKIGEVGLVGNVAATGKPKIAAETGADAVFFNNPDLPETRSEIALPLIIANEVLGVLDVQSNQPNAFTNEDIELLTVLADQISVAIRNARQFQQTRKALADAETIYRQYVRKEWRSLTEDRQKLGYEYTASGLKPLETLTQTSDSTPADEIEKQPDQLSIPVKLRGQVIGMLKIQSNREKNLQKDEIDIAQAVADRVSLAIENARLLESSQDQAARERTIGEITSRIGASVNLRNVLQTAVEELGRVLPGSDVVIQLESSRKKE